MESVPNNGGWLAVIPIIILVGYAAWNQYKKYKDSQKLLHTSTEAGIEKRIEDATKLARERAADWEAAYNAERAQRKFAEEREEIIKESIKELKIRLIARADEIERLEEKCDRVTQFNLTLQAKVEEFGREIKEGK